MNAKALKPAIKEGKDVEDQGPVTGEILSIHQDNIKAQTKEEMMVTTSKEELMIHHTEEVMVGIVVKEEILKDTEAVVLTIGQTEVARDLERVSAISATKKATLPENVQIQQVMREKGAMAAVTSEGMTTGVAIEEEMKRVEAMKDVPHKETTEVVLYVHD